MRIDGADSALAEPRRLQREERAEQDEERRAGEGREDGAWRLSVFQNTSPKPSEPNQSAST